MPIITRKEFATLCNMPNNALAVYMQRGRVIVVDGKVDTDNELNNAFLLKKAGKKLEQVSAPVTPVNQNQITDTPVVGSTQTYSESERQLKYLDTLKRQKEIEKLEIEIAKKKGEVIPSELVKPVFLQHNQSIITQFKNTTDEIIRTFSKRRDLNVNEIAEIKGEITACINDSIQKATVISINSVDVIINDYAEKKGVGERNV